MYLGAYDRLFGEGYPWRKATPSDSGHKQELASDVCPQGVGSVMSSCI